MNALYAFTVKEFQATIRSGKALILAVLFVIFGIMSPAVAKMTPWLMETMADSFAESGLDVTGVTVNALTSWTQFCKNVPVAMIVFLLIFSGVLTAEYEKGTLTAMVTQGLARWKINSAAKWRPPWPCCGPSATGSALASPGDIPGISGTMTARSTS